MQSFSELELTESIHAMLERVGFTIPTPIQAAAVPLILAGKDVIGVAGTGTGKTLAFALPILKHAETSNDPSLILCPTRELAIQIRDVFYKLLGPKPALKVTLLIGGAPMGPQTRSLKLKPQVIIATPGRMMDHLHNGHVTFPNLGLFVLDEADRMLDMGFQPQIEDILKSMPHERQTAMFTATLPPGALRIANKFLRNPEKVSVGEVSKPTQLVKQSTLQATHHTKDAMMLDILNAREGQILVFARTKHRTDKLHAHLQEYGYAVSKIHGGRTQAQRNAAIQGFRGGQFRILVATDVAARGIDVPNIASVINYDLPECGEDYIHRIGRAGRAGVEGEALSLLTPDDRSQWRIISRTVDGSPGGHFGEANGEARDSRAGYRGREDRFSSGRGERPSYRDRPAFGERSSRPSFGDRGARPSFGDRPSFGNRGGRPSFGERSQSPQFGDLGNRFGADRSDRTERAPTYERSDRAERAPTYERSERSERPQFSPRADRPAFTDRSERAEPSERAQRTERRERSGRPEHSERSARPERNERNERPERNERQERAERSEKFARPGRFDQFGDRESDGTARVPRPERPRYQPSERPKRTEDRWVPTHEFRPERKTHSLKSPRKDWAATTPEKKTIREDFSRDRTFTKRRAPSVSVSAGVKRRARPAAPVSPQE